MGDTSATAGGMSKSRFDFISPSTVLVSERGSDPLAFGSAPIMGATSCSPPRSREPLMSPPAGAGGGRTPEGTVTGGT